MCRVRRFSNRVLPAALLALVAGCAPLNFREPLQLPWVSAEKPQVPEEIVATWKDTVLTTPNRPATRGFGGRLMFYRDRGKSPVQVEGSLVVYAFDEDGRDPDDPKPDRKFVFTAEQFAKHYSKSEIGHSYSIWLPWDEVGGPQKTISLIVNFLPTGAGVVKAEQTRHLLPGIVARRQELAKPARQPHRPQVQPVSHQEPVPGQIDLTRADRTGSDQTRAGLPQWAQRRMSTTTIQVPPQFGPSAARCRRPSPQLAAGRVNSPGAVPGEVVPAGIPATQPVPWGYPAAAYPPAYPQQWVPAPTVSPRPAPQRSARFSRARSRPLGGSIAQLTRDHGLWQPRPVGSPFRPPPVPAPQRASESAAISADARPRSY